MKNTKGEWKVNYSIKKVLPSCIQTDKEVICSFLDSTPNLDERIMNAKLIAEAGTITNETGYTPRQLAEQKAELLKTLIWCSKNLNEKEGVGLDIIDNRMKQAIERAIS